MHAIISQPRYLPVLSYLQRIHWADIFVLLDDVQRQGRGVENRNRILTNGKEKIVTIPIRSSSRAYICDTEVDGAAWIKKHTNQIIMAYKKCPYFNEPYIRHVYRGIEDAAPLFKNMMNAMLLNICDIFSLNHNFLFASSLGIPPEITGVERLHAIVKAVGATRYISGANGIHYGVEEEFKNSIPVLYHVPISQPYPQMGQSEFMPWLSFFDQLFNLGLEKTREMITAPLQLKTAEEIKFFDVGREN